MWIERKPDYSSVSRRQAVAALSPYTDGRGGGGGGGFPEKYDVIS